MTDEARATLRVWVKRVYKKRRKLWARVRDKDKSHAIERLATKIYDLYAKQHIGEALPEHEHKGFVRRLRNLAHDCREELKVYPQNFAKLTGDERASRRNAMEVAWEHYERNKGLLGPTFFRAVARTHIRKRGAQTRARIAMRLQPEAALDVFEIIAREIVASEDFPRVRQAKLCGPASLHERTDSLILYVTTTRSETIDKIVRHITEHPDIAAHAFVEGSPYAMRPLGPQGFSFAERARGGRSSHGRSRTDPIAHALYAAMFDGDEGFAAFFRRVDARLTRAEIDPARPWKNSRQTKPKRRA